MEYRAGKCSQCGAEYQVPASFAHNVARCKKCSGVVHLSAAAKAPSAPASPAAEPARRVGPQGAAPEPRPAPAPRTADTPQPAESSPERPARQPSPPAARTAASEARPARAESEPAPEQGKPRLAVPLLGLGLLALAAALYFFRAQVFGGASETKPASATPGSAAPAEPGSALPDGG